MYFLETARVVNYAQGGRSTKSFIAEGRWDTVLKAIKPGDYVIIQFGHNDQKTNNLNRGTQPFGDYTTNLVRFVREARERKAAPILCTPVARRKFDAAGKLVETHGDYARALRSVAKMEQTPLLELGHATENLLQKLGPESSKRLFDWVPAGEYTPDSAALEDDTHFNAYGASRVCDLAVLEIEAKVPALAVHLNRSQKSKQPTTSSAEK
jgi:lysophospholipase L1-like esterase